jgi:hypothetical protein
MTPEQGTPSAAETLREAARSIYMDCTAMAIGRERRTWRAVASLLVNTAAWIDEGLGRCDDLYATNYPDAWNDQREAALTVARAYLGGQP